MIRADAPAGVAFNTVDIGRLHDLFTYDAVIGRVRRKISRGNRRAGDLTGKTHCGGTRYVNVDKVALQEHRVIWAMVHGEWPSATVDHINGDRSDNRIENLRLASKLQQCWNKKMRRDNRIGYKGVSVSGRYYVARITVSGREIYLGTFHNPEDAGRAYAEAARSAFDDFATVRGSHLEMSE